MVWITRYSPSHSSSDKQTHNTACNPLYSPEMGRSRNYKSPSCKNRGTRRLVSFLIKMIKRNRYMKDECYPRMKVLLEQTIDTSSQVGQNGHSFTNNSFCTSTPKRKLDMCMECRKDCIVKHKFGIHIEEWTLHLNWPPDRETGT